MMLCLIIMANNDYKIKSNQIMVLSLINVVAIIKFASVGSLKIVDRYDYNIFSTGACLGEHIDTHLFVAHTYNVI